MTGKYKLLFKEVPGFTYFAEPEDSAMYVQVELCRMSPDKAEAWRKERNRNHNSTLSDEFVHKWNMEKEEVIRKYGRYSKEFRSRYCS